MAVLADRSVVLLRLGVGLVLWRLGAGALCWWVGEGRQWMEDSVSMSLVRFPSCADGEVWSGGEISMVGV